MKINPSQCHNAVNDRVILEQFRWFESDSAVFVHRVEN